MIHNRFVDTLIEILATDIRPVKLVSVLPMMLAGLGFVALIHVSGTKPNHDFDFACKILPAWMWAMMFFVCAAARTVGLFFWSGPPPVKVIVPFLAMGLWVTMFSSNFISEPDSIFAVLYLVPALMETWILGRALDILRGSE